MENKKNSDTMNLELYKNSYMELLKYRKKLFRFCLIELPREFILEELRKKKLIKYDWEKSGYVEKTNIKPKTK